MSRKTIFLSAVSRELEDIRKLLDTAFSRHFDVVTQERSLNQHPGHGIREVLVDAVDSADCVIHLAGRGFGATADAPFPGHPDFVCSWTQFEYCYAHLQGKPVFALICGPSLADPSFVETADSSLGVDEKTRLQQAHCARVVTGRFDDTPFTGLPRTANNRQEKASREELLEAAISICAQMAATDPAYARVQAELQDMRAALGRIEKTQKHLLSNSLLTLAALALLGGGVWLVLCQQGRTDARVASTHQQLDQLDQKVEARFTKERRYMALILARSNERLKDWESMPPAKRFDLALDEIAAEQKIPAAELRALLDLYVSLVEAEPNPDAEDRYYVQMRKQAFAEAARTAETEAEAAVSRMKAAESKSHAAQTLADLEKENAASERKRAIDFFTKEGQAHFTAGDYRKALAAFEKSAALIDQTIAPLDWCETRNRVALCLLHLAEHDRAEPLMKEILSLRESQLPPGDPAIAIAINNLAQIYYFTNRLKEAEPLMERALRINEQAYGKDHPNVAIGLNNLAQLYQATNRLKKAEPLMERALRIDEQAYGKDHPNVARDLINLAQLYKATNRLKESEPLMDRALRIDEQAYGKDHPDVATDLSNIAQLYYFTNRLKEAEPLMERALRINEQAYGKDHPNVAIGLGNLSLLYQATNRLKEAESLMERALRIDEHAYGKDHPNVAIGLGNLALLYEATNRLKEAEPLIERALRINEQAYGKDHPNVARDLNNLAQLYQATNRLKEAEPLIERALRIDEQAYGKDHPNVARDLNNLAQLYQATNRLKEAEPLIERALRIDEQAYGKDHPNVARDLNNLAQLYQATNRLKEAEPLMERALRIDEQAYGKDHPNVAIRLNNLAQLYQATNRLKEAEPSYRCAVIIFLKSTKAIGHDHPHLATALGNYVSLLTSLQSTTEETLSKLTSLGPEAGWDPTGWEKKLSDLYSPADQASASAMDAYHKGDHATALKLWQEALALQQQATPPDATAMRITRMNIASCQVFLGQPAPAREELQAVVKELDEAKIRDSLAARARHHLARALVALDQKPQAIAALCEALAIYKELHADQQVPAQIKESEDLFKQLQP